jgi:hypothetical protein
VVQALSNCTLSENAKVIKRPGMTSTEEAAHWDGTFNNCSLPSWEIKYCIENDPSRFEWADTSGNGKGVIYYMKDDLGNEAPYDFKNILYKVQSDGKTYVLYTFGTPMSTATYDRYDGTRYINIDISVNGNYGECYTNSIKPYITGNRININNVRFESEDGYVVGNTVSNNTHYIKFTGSYLDCKVSSSASGTSGQRTIESDSPMSEGKLIGYSIATL